MEFIKSSSPTELAVTGAALAVAGLSLKYLTKPKAKYPLPPGPKPLPVLGNLLDLPTKDESTVYARMGEAFGDVIYLEALGQKIIVLNSIQAAEDLLERRSAIYSDRSGTVMVHELMKWGWTLAFINYGEQWRTERRMLHDVVHVNMVHQYRGIQLRSARKFLRQLQEDPSEIPELVRNLFGATIVDAAYGIEVESKGDRYVAVAEEALGYLASATLPGAYLVDIITPLKYVPSWMPGAGFKRMAAVCAQRCQEMLDRPMKAVQDMQAAGTAKRCMTTMLLDSVPEGKLTPEREKSIKATAGNAYVAGSDTTVSAVTSLFLAMAKYPKVLQRAHAELDQVVGTDQLPDFTHMKDLPYITSICLELLRWQPVLPVGVPHKSAADDEYRGYFIPNGTIIMANQRAMLHNPEDYPEPEEFKPERYLKQSVSGGWEFDKTVRDPRTIAFGFGRRICPGQHFAADSLFATVANVLAAFDIIAPLNPDGTPAYPTVKLTPGLLSHPIDFKCVVKARSQHAEELISQPLPDRGM